MTSLATLPKITLGQLGAERLASLCDALGFQSRKAEIARLFEHLSTGWGERLVGSRVAWESAVVDDGTPFEFSAAYGSAPELRILSEPWGPEPSLVSNAEATCALLETLAREYSIDLQRFERVRDLFLPQDPKGPFSIWIATIFKGDAPPDFKLYLCPQARGDRWSSALLEEALVRLGFGGAWGLVGPHMGARGPELDVFNYFSLDLAPSPEARVKIYARHHDSRPEDFEHIASACEQHQPGDLLKFFEAAAPGRTLFDNRPPSTCYAFVEGRGDSPLSITTHFPINGYARDDGEVAESVVRCHRAFGLDEAPYRSTLAALSTRELEEGIGFQSYVSFRRQGHKPRLTVYLPCEAFRPGTVAGTGATLKPSNVYEIVRRYEDDGDITTHPFIRRLSREPFNRKNTWILLANLFTSEGNRPRRLAQLAARVETNALRSAIAAVLSEELGHGQFERAPLRGFCALMMELESWRPSLLSSSEEQALLAPGRQLEARLEELGAAADPHVGTGALLAGEVFRRQLADFLKLQVSRDESPRATELPWQSNTKRFDPTTALSSSVPEAAFEPLWLGAMERRRAEWAFLDALYGVCFATS